MGLPVDRFFVFDVTVSDPSELSPSDFAAVAITGSHSMVSDRLPWSEKTAAWLRDRVAGSGIPTLGICYGHQLLNQALGGMVGNNPLGDEDGCADLSFRDSAAKDDLFSRISPADLACARGYVSHTQTILEPSPGLVVLATGSMDGHHAVRFANGIWGTQFHPEFDQVVAREYAAEPPPSGPKALLEIEKTDGGFGAKVLRAFADLVTSQFPATTPTLADAISDDFFESPSPATTPSPSAQRQQQPHYTIKMEAGLWFLRPASVEEDEEAAKGRRIAATQHLYYSREFERTAELCLEILSDGTKMTRAETQEVDSTLERSRRKLERK